MKITRLEVESFKRVAAVTIEPDGHTVVIGGKNGSGKSSTLDAIEAAIGGKRNLPDAPIKHGATKARIALETDTLKVVRTFSAKGTNLQVFAKDGAKYASPQALLDGLVGPISFDPVTFVRSPPKKQADVIARLAGLDTSALDAKQRELYEHRTELGRELKSHAARLEAMPETPEGVPDIEVSLGDMLRQYREAEEHNAKNELQRSQLIDALAVLDGVGHEIHVLEERLSGLRARKKRIMEECSAFEKECGALMDRDLDALSRAIEASEATNRQVAAKHARCKAASVVVDTQAKVNDLTVQLSQLGDERTASIAAAKYPVAGLAVDGETVMFNGVPLAQSSSAEQLRVSTAISLAMNPELRVALIRDGSLLDEHSLRAVAEVAAEHDAQVWIERVSTGDEVSVVIEDGMVVDNA